MSTPLFTGVCTALVTPFRKDRVDFSMLHSLMERQLSAGVSAIALCATTGEAATLSREEKLTVYSQGVRYAAGRCKILAATGTNDTSQAVSLSRMAQDCGADGLLVVTPYYNKASQSGLVEHYAAIADSVQIPVIVYNVPSRTGMTITAETYAALARHPNIHGVKEASGDFSLVSRIRNRCGDDLHIWSGNDETVAAIMALGGRGVISTTANLVPEAFVRLCKASLAGNFEEAAHVQNSLMPLIDAMFCDVNPIPIKAALAMKGFDAGGCRAPLSALSEEHREQISALISNLNF